MTVYIQIIHNQILRKNHTQNTTSSAELEMLSVSHTFHHRPLSSVLKSMKFTNAVLTSRNQEAKWPCAVGLVACRALRNIKHTHSSTWEMDSSASCTITWASAMQRTRSKFGNLHPPLLLSQCHLCLLVSGMGWVGRDLSKAVWSKPHPRQGYHSSTHFSKGPVKLLLALTWATADPETGACSLPQTCSNFPWRRCPLTTGQQSFTSFKTFAGYKWLWRGIAPFGSERTSFRMF